MNSFILVTLNIWRELPMLIALIVDVTWPTTMAYQKMPKMLTNVVNT